MVIGRSSLDNRGGVRPAAPEFFKEGLVVGCLCIGLKVARRYQR